MTKYALLRCAVAAFAAVAWATQPAAQPKPPAAKPAAPADPTAAEFDKFRARTL